MTRQNRVLPTGQIVAEDWRGALMGNRGILHDEAGQLGTARWRHKAWIACRLTFGNRHRRIMAPNRYTELFFTDDATALAAGHRPCFECRRAQASAFAHAWASTFGQASAPAMDRALHDARVVPGTRAQQHHTADCAALPDHTFILNAGRPARLQGDRAHPLIRGRYHAPQPRPAGRVTVLTPAPIVEIMTAGYAPEMPRHVAERGPVSRPSLTRGIIGYT